MAGPSPRQDVSEALAPADSSGPDHQVDQRCSHRRGIVRLRLPRHGRAFRSAHGGETGRTAYRERTERREEAEYGVSFGARDRAAQGAPT